MDYIPEISLPSTGGGHEAGCGSAIFVFVFVAILMAIFVAVIGWALKSAGV